MKIKSDVYFQYGAFVTTPSITTVCKCGNIMPCKTYNDVHCVSKNGPLLELVVNESNKNSFIPPFDVRLHYTQRKNREPIFKVYFERVFLISRWVRKQDHRAIRWFLLYNHRLVIKTLVFNKNRKPPFLYHPRSLCDLRLKSKGQYTMKLTSGQFRFAVKYSVLSVSRLVKV